MKPIKFKEANSTYVSPEPNTGDLPAYSNGRELVSCWKMTWRERFSALFFGTIWLGVQGQQQPPVWIEANKNVFMKG